MPFVLTSRFNAPRSYGNGLHEGADYDVVEVAGDSKQPVLCMYPGVVTRSEYGGAYGHKVVVKHQRNGHEFYTWYAHLDSRYVSVGDFVGSGSHLGELGDTGGDWGEHVHINLQVPGFGLQGYVVSDVVDPDPYISRTVPSGSARLGLHASADPGDLSNQEFSEFRDTKPGVIKVLSAHSASSITKLALDNMEADTFIVRAFLNFGGRNITPLQFYNDTKNDVLRAISSIPANRKIILELHNEPNLAPEGLFGTWPDGIAFDAWLKATAAHFRALVPSVSLMYPGLSPGGSVPGIRQDHKTFIEQSRSAVNNMDYLGVHVYWSNSYPMTSALAVLDDYANRFPNKPIWITEASHNRPGLTPTQKGMDYILFWNALKTRPQVKGVTYFVASASNPAFGWGDGGSCETWVGQGIGATVGQR